MWSKVAGNRSPNHNLDIMQTLGKTPNSQDWNDCQVAPRQCFQVLAGTASNRGIPNKPTGPTLGRRELKHLV